MKDLIKRISISVVSWMFLGYTVFLWMNNTIIAGSEYLRFNVYYFVLLLVIWLFLFVMFGVYPIHIKFTKPTLFFIWVFLIVFWQYFLVEYSLDNKVYLQDIVKIFWVVLSILSLTNVLITDKVKKQKEDSNAQVIEV